MTGIYKHPVDKGIVLRRGGVEEDNVIDRRYHGGEAKAVYMYSADHYDYWKRLYPELDWDWGMFGENLTIEGLDEARLFSGSRYRIGEQVIVELTTPREPCYKLGHRFGSSKLIRQFMEKPYPGVYASVIEEGCVRPGDRVVEISQPTGGKSIARQYLDKMEAKTKKH